MSATPEQLLAHSGRRSRGIRAQSYWEHARNTSCLAGAFAASATGFWNGERNAFVSDLVLAGLLHDCGKLEPENQAVLASSESARLAVPHEEAGVAWLLEERHTLGAILVASHHAGLSSIAEELTKLSSTPPGKPFRRSELIRRTDAALASIRDAYVRAGVDAERMQPCPWLRGLSLRIALSCLVDADHSDTARHYGGEAVDELRLRAPRRWGERLNALDRYVSAFPKEGARAGTRSHLYQECREAKVFPAMRSCDAAVGTGKTTAAMAHLLRVAESRSFRRIFVVLPYTNIIQQSVDTYRKALVLEGEEPEEIVAELHHLADFSNADDRALAALWRAPVIVTTAVQFFETLAASRTATLRKLHELPGSAVFVDEAHAAMPPKLWPVAWEWLEELADAWSCHFVFGSGSLVRFWDLPLIASRRELPDLVSPSLRAEIEGAEKRRVFVRPKPDAVNFDEAISLIESLPGPRLAIFNTVQNAAVVADRLARRLGERGEKFLFHLSSALSPADRRRAFERIRKALPGADVTVIATSCIEAGVDLSFRSGVREACSLASLIQTSGRVNRHADASWPESELISIRVVDPRASANRSFDGSRRVLDEMLEDNVLETLSLADCMTEALRRELVLRDVHEFVERLRRAASDEDYPRVSELFRVIDGDTRLVIVDERLAEKLSDYEVKISSREILAGSVQLWARRIDRLGLQPLETRPSIFRWGRPYEASFLGYMKGLVEESPERMPTLENP